MAENYTCGSIKAPYGANTKKTIVGRGASSKGRTSGRGSNGQNSRSGGGVRPGFEGGQTSLARRMPKRGFNNIFATEYTVVNVADLEARFENGAVIDTEALIEAGLVTKVLDGVKILGNGEVTKNFTVKAAKFSESAKAKIDNAGGKAEVL